MTPTHAQIEAAAKVLYIAQGGSELVWADISGYPNTTHRSFIRTAFDALTAAYRVNVPSANSPLLFDPAEDRVLASGEEAEKLIKGE
jgi:hypothetical protein